METLLREDALSSLTGLILVKLLSSPEVVMSNGPQQVHHTSRREFLATSAAALAAAPVAAGAAPAVHAAGDETLKLAIVGCGGRGAGAAAQALSTKGPVKLWAMADAFEEPLTRCLRNLARGLSARYDRDATAGLEDRIDVPPDRRFVGLDAYRQAIDSGVDVVILTGPPGFRPIHFDYAVQAGKHVFMEKPLATDAPGVRQVLAAAEAARQKGLKVGVGLQRRHQASYEEIIPRLHDGVIGDVLTLRCYWNGAGSAKVPPPRHGLTELEYQVRNWYYFTWLSGDHICEQHIHNLDVCNWIKQAHPIEAQGQGGREVRTGHEYGNIFDHHMVEFTYADGSKMFSQCRHIPNCWNRVAEHARGTEGTVDLQGSRFTLSVDGQDPLQYRRRKDEGNPYQVEHDVLFDAIRNGKPHNEAEYGAHSTMTAILGRMATYSGKVVSWEDAIQSDLELITHAESWDAEAPTLPDEDGRYPSAVPGVTQAW